MLSYSGSVRIFSYPTTTNQAFHRIRNLLRRRYQGVSIDASSTEGAKEADRSSF
jgi:hypothetical protein